MSGHSANCRPDCRWPHHRNRIRHELITRGMLTAHRSGEFGESRGMLLSKRDRMRMARIEEHIARVEKRECMPMFLRLKRQMAELDKAEKMMRIIMTRLGVGDE